MPCSKTRCQGFLSQKNYTRMNVIYPPPIIACKSWSSQTTKIDMSVPPSTQSQHMKRSSIHTQAIVRAFSNSGLSVTTPSNSSMCFAIIDGICRGNGTVAHLQRSHSEDMLLSFAEPLMFFIAVWLVSKKIHVDVELLYCS